jgi:hypothetical protein
VLASGQEEEDRASRLATSHGLALVALGISISLNELAIGFSIGLVRLPVPVVIAAIAAQAFVAAQLGLALGAKIGERWRERRADRGHRPEPARRLADHRAARPVGPGRRPRSLRDISRHCAAAPPRPR